MPAVTDILNAVISTHVECDIGIFVVDGDGYIISTHVECDRMNDKKHNASNNFNSRTHVECDPAEIMRYSATETFQLTHSRGVRR